jgi:hypothetical protein
MNETLANLTTVQIFAFFVFSALVLLSVFLKVGRIFGYISTIVHEFGHALFAKVLGEKVAGFKLNYDTSGETLVLTSGRKISSIIVGLAGYPAPIIFGVFGWLTVLYGNASGFLALFFIMGLMIILLIRNFFAVIPIFIVWGMIFIAFIVGEVAVSIVTVMLSTILIFFGTKDLTFIVKENPPYGDAHMVAESTKTNSRFWAIMMAIISATNALLLIVFSSQIFGAFAYIYEELMMFFEKIAAIY